MQEEVKDDDLMTPNEVAEKIKVQRSTLYAYISAGKVPAPIRIGTRPRWSRRELSRWIEAGAPNAERWEKLKRRPQG